MRGPSTSQSIDTAWGSSRDTERFCRASTTILRHRLIARRSSSLRDVTDGTGRAGCSHRVIAGSPAINFVFIA